MHDGLNQKISTSMSENKKLSSLPDSYTDIRPVSRFNNSLEIANYSAINNWTLMNWTLMKLNWI